MASLSERPYRPVLLVVALLAPMAGVLVYAGWREVLPAFLRPLLQGEGRLWLESFRLAARETWDMPDWLAHSLPDGLWGMGLSALLTWIWWETPYATRVAAFSAVAVPLWEALQALGILDGTACPVDALVGVACCLPVWVLTLRVRHSAT